MSIEKLPPPVEKLAPVDALATELLKVVEAHNPTYETSFAALAALVVGLSMQYVYAGTGDITDEEMAAQLTRFQGFTAELGLLKMRKVNEQIESMRQLEKQASEIQQRLQPKGD